MKRTRWSHYKYYCKHESINWVSRKTKKYILGRKMNKRKLNERLAAVVVEQRPYPEGSLLSDYFCPKCGCDETRSTGNMADYPELWVRSYCMRCGFLVAEADNSPTYFALEYPEYNYELN
ncbi:hypothetical protein DMN77_08180 [Paenibacillus sp. 79R4]|uniref:hypothetical protein n=1 Tax=Paenibacillus sp. 79R4 TaxID=2212847 RepID=UPI0015BFC607|nr:hypothetical protein [Paenibacillus sp. 79R4]NWL87581.1 hypothetical protein [Paenibacillus sp. 79R4]